MEAIITYKVVELSIVTDEAIEEVLNAWTKKGWTFERLQFAMGEGSKRPTMAFVFFVRSGEASNTRKGGQE